MKKIEEMSEEKREALRLVEEDFKNLKDIDCSFMEDMEFKVGLLDAFNSCLARKNDEADGKIDFEENCESVHQFCDLYSAKIREYENLSSKDDGDGIGL